MTIPMCGQPRYDRKALTEAAKRNDDKIMRVGMPRPKEVRVRRRDKRTLWARIWGWLA